METPLVLALKVPYCDSPSGPGKNATAGHSNFKADEKVDLYWLKSLTQKKKDSEIRSNFFKAAVHEYLLRA
jgi:hypothetical protein